MKNDINYKIIKTATIKSGNSISIIEIEQKKYILKKVVELNKNLINMLKNEINILYKLKDINVSPKIYYYKFDKDNNFIIIELIKGKTINRLNLDTFEEKISLMLKVTDVVKKFHKLNIIHCDLKPSNILLDINQNIKIIDYGISVNNQKNYFSGYGSVRYCSKKQLEGELIDKTVDIYSLGIILYELILGKLPFEGTKPEIINKKKNNNYEKTDNVFLNLIFSKIFDDKNDRKYKTIEEFENDLRLLLSLLNKCKM